LGVIRTGRRDGEDSAKGPALKAASHAARHESAGFDFSPRGEVGHISTDREMNVLGTDKLIIGEIL
jgi:hypothetical protein